MDKESCNSEKSFKIVLLLFFKETLPGVTNCFYPLVVRTLAWGGTSAFCNCLYHRLARTIFVLAALYFDGSKQCTLRVEKCPTIL